ncbi:MAG: MCE family protein [Chlorobi bacterium]|nr:MCE family protein [Chlorobiota bacterium]
MKTEIKVGILIVIVVSAGILGYQFLEGYDILGRSNEYYIVFDNAGGLEPASPVTIKGMQVGKVLDITLALDQNYYNPPVIVHISLSSDIRLTRSTEAHLVSADILGSRAIELKIKPDNVYLEPGDTIKGVVALTVTEMVAQEMAPLKAKTERLLASIDTLIGTVSYFLQGANKKKLEKAITKTEQSLTNLYRITATLDTLLKSQRRRISAILAHLEQVSVALANEKESIQRIIANTADLTDSLKAGGLPEAIASLNHSLIILDSILTDIQQGKGTLGHIAKDDSLYLALTQTLRDLDSLLVDMKERPYRYVHVSLIGPSPKKIHKWEMKMERKYRKQRGK